MTSPQADLLDDTPGDAAVFGALSGVVSREKIGVMRRRRWITAAPDIDDSQLQPASLDLRLGPKAYRIRASFLPGRARTVQDQLTALAADEISLEGPGAILEKGCVYVVPLLERLDLPESVSGVANPKSSTGRLDIFTRLITDRSEIFDNVERGYSGPLYAEVSPRSFSVRVHKGSRLNQVRFRRWNPQQTTKLDFAVPDRELQRRHEEMWLVDEEPLFRGGLIVRVALSQEALGPVVGYRAKKHTSPIDVEKIGALDPADYWDELRAQADKRLILDPGEFYILASREKLHIPPDLAAEMEPIDPAMGEFRVHYAGFFDPGFGWSEGNQPGARAVLEVRSHEVPFILEDGQIIGRLAFEKMPDRPETLYGQIGTSNYQGQGLKLSKHFRMR